VRQRVYSLVANLNLGDVGTDRVELPLAHLHGHAIRDGGGAMMAALAKLPNTQKNQNQYENL